MKYQIKSQWKVMGIWSYEWKLIIDEKGIDIEELTEYGVTPWVDASVPGSIHNDLYKAGIIEEPYYGMNSIKCEWIHQRAWVYRTNFKLPKQMKKSGLTLCFDGVDYYSYYYLNGKYLGSHEGMFTPVKWDIADKNITENNELIVVI